MHGISVIFPRGKNMSVSLMIVKTNPVVIIFTMEHNTNRESKLKFLGKVIVLPLQALSHHRESVANVLKPFTSTRCLNFNITHALVVVVESTP